jgi:hypothetical protein
MRWDTLEERATRAPRHPHDAGTKLGAAPPTEAYAPECVEGEFSEVGGLCLLSDYGDRAMGVPDNRIRDTAQQSPL